MAESPFSHHGDNMGGSKGDPNQCDGEGVASSQDAAGLTSSTTTDKKPLRLLDLPMDILTEIIKEVNWLFSCFQYFCPRSPLTSWVHMLMAFLFLNIPRLHRRTI